MEDATSLGDHRLGERDRGIDGDGLAQLADTRPLFQKGHRSTDQAAVVHELIADRTAGPTAAEERNIAIQSFFTDLAGTRFDAQ